MTDDGDFFDPWPCWFWLWASAAAVVTLNAALYSRGFYDPR